VSSRPDSSRHAVGSDATGPNKAGWLRSTARSGPAGQLHEWTSTMFVVRRRIFASSGSEAFLEGHVHAFTTLGGVPTGKIHLSPPIFQDS
jgi:hypothetical protein